VAEPAFRRGFKATAERIALELREELGLATNARLEPSALAEHLCVPVFDLLDLTSAARGDVAHLLGRVRSAFSAVTIYVGRFKRVIVTNPAHANTRHMSNLCHELSHIVLDHETEHPLNADGRRVWDARQEREADWLASCLLIPGAAAHDATRAGLSDEAVAQLFGVSTALAAWRMNSTGARLRAKRLARFK
jgi:Zn-dependent peptidase ImmA (M78 family)